MKISLILLFNNIVFKSTYYNFDNLLNVLIVQKHIPFFEKNLKFKKASVEKLSEKIKRKKTTYSGIFIRNNFIVSVSS